MARMVDLAKEAFVNRNYHVAVELYEGCLRDTKALNRLDIYFGYGDALARCGRIKDSFDVYAHICHQLGHPVPVERLKHLSYALLDSVVMVAKHRRQRSTTSVSSTSSTASASAMLTHSLSTCIANGIKTARTNIPTTVANNHGIPMMTAAATATATNRSPLTINHVDQIDAAGRNMVNCIDPLCCAKCEDVLKCPVTAVCGHTFCRKCCVGQTQCRVCDRRLVTYGDSFKQDVLVLRLVEKWWSPEIKASKSNDEALIYLHRNALDEALKACNESLEKCPNSYQGLLLRSEVLYRLSHFQSALADADNALKSRPTSYKAYYRRACALTGLGHTEEALLSHCISVYLNTSPTSSTISQRYDVAKLIQRLIVGLPPSMRICRYNMPSSMPYSVLLTRKRQQRRQHQRQQHRKHFTSSVVNGGTNGLECRNDLYDGGATSECDEVNSSCDDLRSHASEDIQFLQQEQLQGHRKYGRNRKFFWRHCFEPDEGVLSNGASEAASIVIIPRRNSRIRNVLDRINQELIKMKRADQSSLTTTKCWLNVNANLIDLSDFECVLCYRTLWKPVVTPCGHTYCLVCLDRCLDYSSHCPLCKSSLVVDECQSFANNFDRSTTPTSFSMSKKCVTKFLEIAMQRFIPAAYAKRQIQEIEKEPSVPVFICTTAFPYVPCPLFVYESRYRLMIRRAIESGEKQFGIAQPHSGQQRYTDYGTMLDIKDCVLLGDGCSILSTVGCRRFRVIARKEKDGYDTAKVEYIDDEPVSKDRMQIVGDLHTNVFYKAVAWYDSLPWHTREEILKSFGCMPTLEVHWESLSDGPAWSWYIIAILPLSQQLKVEILATTNLEKRLRAIDKTLEYVAAQKRRSVCVVPCDSIQAGQTIDCCQPVTSTSTTTQLINDHTAAILNTNNADHQFAAAATTITPTTVTTTTITTTTDHYH